MARHQQLFRAGRYVEALPVIEQAVELAAQFRESDFRRTDSTGKLAMTLDYLGRFDEAAKLYNEILERIRANPGNELASTGLLRSIGRIHVLKHRFKDAEGFYQEAQKIDETMLDPNDSGRVEGLASMVDLYLAQGRHSEAKPYAERAVALVKSVPGETLLHARALQAMAWVYMGFRLFDQAQPLLERILRISEQNFGSNGPQTAPAVENLAALYLMTGNKAEAGKYFRRVLTINEKALGPEHPAVASNINDLALTLDYDKDAEEVESLLTRSLQITTKRFGSSSPNLAMPLMNIGTFYSRTGKADEAERYLRRAVDVTQMEEQARDSVFAMHALSNLAGLLRDQKKFTEAERLASRALEIAEKKNGADDRMIAGQCRLLAEVYSVMEEHPKAVALSERAVTITEKNPGANTPDHGASLVALARALTGAKEFEKAEPLYLQAIKIFEEKGPAASIAFALRKYAELLESTNRSAEAAKLRNRADELSPEKRNPK